MQSYDLELIVDNCHEFRCTKCETSYSRDEIL